MKHTTHTLVLLAAMLTMMWTAVTHAADAPPKEDQTVTVEGKLEASVAIGGESTGWMLKKGGSDKAASIDVDMSAIDKADAFDGKQITITGPMHLKKFVERGEVWILKATAVKAAAVKPVHLFILSGQSNMAGMKPEAGFVPEAGKQFADGEVVYVKVASGGVPIRLWVESWNEIAKKHGLTTMSNGTKFYKPILDQVAAKLNGSTPKTITFCWMQGERDAKEGLHAAYEDAMKQLIADLRRDLKHPEMYFVIGRISDHGAPDFKEWQSVRDTQVKVANADPRGAWVDCDDLNDIPKDGKTTNDLHYTADGYKVLGERYARQAKLLIGGKKPAADGRPQ